MERWKHSLTQEQRQTRLRRRVQTLSELYSHATSDSVARCVLVDIYTREQTKADRLKETNEKKAEFLRSKEKRADRIIAHSRTNPVYRNLADKTDLLVTELKTAFHDVGVRSVRDATLLVLFDINEELETRDRKSQTVRPLVTAVAS